MLTIIIMLSWTLTWLEIAIQRVSFIHIWFNCSNYIDFSIRRKKIDCSVIKLIGFHAKPLHGTHSCFIELFLSLLQTRSIALSHSGKYPCKVNQIWIIMDASHQLNSKFEVIASYSKVSISTESDRENCPRPSFSNSRYIQRVFQSLGWHKSHHHFLR